VHPEVTARFSLTGRAAADTLHIDALFAGVPAPKIMQPVPLFPDITYDSTHTLKRTQEAGPLLETASKADPLLTGIEIVDMYTGKPLADNEYNLTIRCTYSAAGRTLTEEEARKAHEKVLRLIK
ncbi:MAG: Phenylalanyl-tRNA synthetase subunit beta, partial [Candidatus Peribacteria bacterium]|nr:Phenylalanyl-tRNA synthetase subunit beta [Candidatus Peribacteria bacterium]